MVSLWITLGFLVVSLAAARIVYRSEYRDQMEGAGPDTNIPALRERAAREARFCALIVCGFWWLVLPGWLTGWAWRTLVEARPSLTPGERDWEIRKLERETADPEAGPAVEDMRLAWCMACRGRVSINWSLAEGWPVDRMARDWASCACTCGHDVSPGGRGVQG